MKKTISCTLKKSTYVHDIFFKLETSSYIILQTSERPERAIPDGSSFSCVAGPVPILHQDRDFRADERLSSLFPPRMPPVPDHSELIVHVAIFEWKRHRIYGELWISDVVPRPAATASSANFPETPHPDLLNQTHELGPATHHPGGEGAGTL